MKKVFIIGFVCLIFLIGGAIAFYFYSQPPKEKLSDEFKEEAVTKLLGRKAQLDEKNVPTGSTLYDGKYITFSYPAKALPYEYKDPFFASNSSVLDSFSFDIKTPRLVLNLQVLENSSKLQSIEDYPAARLRKDRSYEYEKNEVAIGSYKGLRFTKITSPPEDTFLFLAENRIYSLAITGSDPEEVEKLGAAFLKSAKLK